MNQTPINTFRELMNEINWSWEEPHEIISHGDGTYSLNKLFIAPTYVNYKTESYELSEGAYNDFVIFWRLLYK